jgi:protein-S-isoprenylcysteine O-methyltransferase Ste14
VNFPPPLVFVAGFVVTWVLNQRMEFLIDGKGARPPQQGIGVAALAIGLGLAYWGMSTFWRARTPVVPVKAARLLVTSGPYRFTRNPMYVGLTIAYFGIALLLNWAWPLVLLPVVLVVMNTAVIEREERHLRAAFPGEYDRFCEKTRRWL